MKVLFVYSLDNILPGPKSLRSWSCMQHGISSISSLLKVHGHQTSLLVLGSNFYQKSVKLLKTALDGFNPDLICFTAVYSQSRFIAEVARFVKKQWPAIYLLAGGVHASLQPEEAISGPFDAVCVGEGEFPTLELCQLLGSRQPPHGVANLWIKSADGGVEKNPPRAFVQTLDALPHPDREMWKPWIDDRKADEMTVLCGRGCPYKCTYCSNDALQKIATGPYVRMRSPENILQEIIFLYKHYPHRYIYLEVETLDCNKPWVTELCHKLAEFNASVPDPISYGSNYRINPNTIDEELFATLETANFKDLNIGLESGSERVRRDVLHRHYANEDFLKVVSLARKHGMGIFVYNMIGLPGESQKEHQETVRLNRLCQPEGHHTGIFFPYPGTDLYATCIEKGLMNISSGTGMERRQPVLDQPDFPKREIRRAYTWFHYHVYKGHIPFLKLLVQVALIKIDSSLMLKFPFQKVTRLLSTMYFHAKNHHS